ncbi:MAG: pentapeptide repeat-containing protein [Candidatus Nanopelagicales bacterium]
MNSSIRRLIILAAATVLPVTLLSGPMASPAQAAESTDTYNQKVKGLNRLQASGASPNEFSLTVGPAVGWNAGLEGLKPPPASMYRLWDMKVAWKDVNPQQGVFDWTVLDRRVALVESWGGTPLLVLGLTPQWAAVDPAAGDERWGFGTASPPSNIADWNNYVSAVVNRYGSRIGGYELWNEANLPTFWQGSIEKLYEMAASASSIIKAANPAAIVLAPSTTTRLRKAARDFTAGFASQIPDGTKGPFDAWTIHSYPTGSAGVNDDGTKSPRAAADKRVDDILNWQNALVDAVGSDSPALDLDIYDTEVNYGLKGPGIEPGQNWSADEATQLMNMTYQDSKNLGINSTFWYQYTSTPYDLLGVQWNPSQPGLDAMWNTMRTTGIPQTAGLTLLSNAGDYAIPNFKNCFIRPKADCSLETINQSLKGIDLSGATLTDIDFSGAFLLDANLSGTTLRYVDFSGANLMRADMRGSTVDGTNNLQAKTFYRADFSGATLTDISIHKGKFLFTKWENATIRNSAFPYGRFYRANFDGVDIKNSDMRYTKMGKSSWKGATVKRVNFRDSNFNSEFSWS